jgi:hypothetical protein
MTASNGIEPLSVRHAFERTKFAITDNILRHRCGALIVVRMV